MTKENRRNFLKSSGSAVVGAAVVAAGATQTAEAQNVRLNPNAKAVLPDGKQVSRGEILSQLGLDPGTSPDAWLAIVACGSNASALKPGALRGLVDRGVIKKNMLDANSLKILK